MNNYSDTEFDNIILARYMQLIANEEFFSQYIKLNKTKGERYNRLRIEELILHLFWFVTEHDNHPTRDQMKSFMGTLHDILTDEKQLQVNKAVSYLNQAFRDVEENTRTELLTFVNVLVIVGVVGYAYGKITPFLFSQLCFKFLSPPRMPDRRNNNMKIWQIRKEIDKLTHIN